VSNNIFRTVLGKKFGALTALVCFYAGGPVAAQWLKYPTPGIPRSADGKPNFAAPAPKTADGKPDLSGIWLINNLGYVGNITAGLEPGDMLPWAETLSNQRISNLASDAPPSHCLPTGPTIGLFGLQKVIQTPGLVAILHESGVFRQVFTDGRPLPEDPSPTWQGYSIGQWVGNTLVVETAGFNDKSWLDVSGHPHTEALRVTERFLRKDFGHIQLEMTFDDPKTFTKVWSITVIANLVPDTDLLEYVCNENERDIQHLVGKLSGVKVAPAILSKYVGTYHATGTDFEITISDGGTLKMNINGRGAVALPAMSQTSFYYAGLGADVEFFADAQGKVTHLIFAVAEGEAKAERK
jgi:hypothetical protein